MECLKEVKRHTGFGFYFSVMERRGSHALMYCASARGFHNPMCWLIWFFFNLTQLESSEKGEPQLKNTPIRLACRQACGSFSCWRLIWKAQPTGSGSWGKADILGGPGVCKEAGWASQEGEVSKQRPSMDSIPVPASRCLPCLSSWYGFPQWRTVISTYKPNKFFPP